MVVGQPRRSDYKKFSVYSVFSVVIQLNTLVASIPEYKKMLEFNGGGAAPKGRPIKFSVCSVFSVVIQLKTLVASIPEYNEMLEFNGGGATLKGDL